MIIIAATTVPGVAAPDPTSAAPTMSATTEANRAVASVIPRSRPAAWAFPTIAERSCLLWLLSRSRSRSVWP